MKGFITALLLQNEAGASYQDKIYDRFLRFQHLNGQILSVFDPYGPVSTDLRVGEVYEVILASLATSVRYFSGTPPAIEDAGWQGVIIEPRWYAPENAYQRTSSELNAYDWVLLETSLGNVLINSQVFDVPVSSGGIVQWSSVRLDLLAVV